MPSLLERLRETLSLRARADRRNVQALSTRVGLPLDQASIIYRRARVVGFGAAMTEHEERTRSARPLDAPAPERPSPAPERPSPAPEIGL